MHKVGRIAKETQSFREVSFFAVDRIYAFTGLTFHLMVCGSTQSQSYRKCFDILRQGNNYLLLKVRPTFAFLPFNRRLPVSVLIARHSDLRHIFFKPGWSGTAVYTQKNVCRINWLIY